MKKVELTTSNNHFAAVVRLAKSIETNATLSFKPTGRVVEDALRVLGYSATVTIQ